MTENSPTSAAGGTPMSERMQSLLSRAVEDQLSEQRQLAGALSDVRGQLARLGEELTELRSRPSGDVGEFRAALTALESQVRSQGEALSGLAGALEAVPAYGDRVSALSDQVAALHDRIGAIDTLGSANDGLNSRLSELERSVAQIGPMLGEVGEASTEHSAGLGDLQTRFDALAIAVQQLSTSGADTASLEQRLTTLQEDVTALGSDVAGLVEGSVDRASVQAAADAAQSAADRVARIDDIAAQVGDLRLNVSGPDGVAATVEQLRSELGALSEAVQMEDREGQVRAIVDEAIQQAETRIRDHVDDAIIALAEALLRRRYSADETEAILNAEIEETGPSIDISDSSVGGSSSYYLEPDDDGLDPEAAIDEVPLPLRVDKAAASEDSDDSEAADDAAWSPERPAPATVSQGGDAAGAGETAGGDHRKKRRFFRSV